MLDGICSSYFLFFAINLLFNTDRYIFAQEIKIMSKAERTRAFIIEKTAPVFNTRGYAGTSLTDLTKATGLTKGAIYGNFEGKDEVALEAFRFNMHGITSKLSQELFRYDSAIDKLKALVNYYRSQFIKDYLATGCPIVNLAPEVDDTHEELRTAVNTAIKKWYDTIVSIVNLGVSNGQIAKGVNPKEVARQLISAIEGGILISKSTGDISFITSALELCDQKIESIKT